MPKLKGPAKRLGKNKWYIPQDRPDAVEERKFIKESETYRQLWHLYTELEQENAKLKERVEELELELNKQRTPRPEPPKPGKV